MILPITEKGEVQDSNMMVKIVPFPLTGGSKTLNKQKSAGQSQDSARTENKQSVDTINLSAYVTNASTCSDTNQENNRGSAKELIQHLTESINKSSSRELRNTHQISANKAFDLLIA